MWAIIIFSVLFLVFAVFAVSSLSEGELFGTICFGVISAAMFISALLSAANVGNEAPKIRGRHYYEVIVTAPVPGKGTLVYVVDLDGNKGKADILTKYPIDGYKIEQAGKRTYLLPVNTTVTTDDKGKIFLVSEDGEVVSVPTALKAEGPVNPPLSGM